MFVFEWDTQKEAQNIEKHGVSFETASIAFSDTNVILASDEEHSKGEERWFCYGLVDGDVMTVRFTMRGNAIRIIGAAYWRKGRKLYEKAYRDIR
jgi:hypothetical protein